MSYYKEKAASVFNFVGTLNKENPDIGQGFVKMHQFAGKKTVLDTKQKELIALGIAITIRCEGCIACHVQGSIEAGATHEEIVETIGIAVLMGGGPSIVYGDIAYKAMEEMK